MRAEHINPFIESVRETFESMLESSVAAGKPLLPRQEGQENEIIGMIGLSGTAQGMVALKFPERTALNAVSRMVGMEYTKIDPSIIDGVGELINIIAGNAKTKFQGQRIFLSLPTVVKGSICHLSNLGDAVLLVVPFSSKLGKFEILVSFKSAPADKKEAARASAHSR
jgi:chemotaxis protein CheX